MCAERETRIKIISGLAAKTRHPHKVAEHLLDLWIIAGFSPRRNIKCHRGVRVCLCYYFINTCHYRGISHIRVINTAVKSGPFTVKTNALCNLVTQHITVLDRQWCFTAPSCLLRRHIKRLRNHVLIKITMQPIARHRLHQFNSICSHNPTLSFHTIFM